MSQIYGMAWSPRTNLLASASGDGTVRIWSGADGSTARVLRGPALAPLSVAWSPSGDVLAIGNFDGTLALIETQTGSVLTTLSGPPLAASRGDYPYAAYGVSWAPDGKRLASTRYDRYVLVWDAHSNKVLAALSVDSQPNAVAWSPDGARFASSHDDGTVRLWNGASYAAGATLAAPDDAAGWAFPLAWSPDGQLLAAARDSGLVQWWDVSRAQQVAALEGHDAGAWAMSC
jgi:WD40 repeat protein